MKYTAAHWGAYRFSPGDRDLNPLPDDPDPSRVGRGWVSAALNRDARVLRPVARKGWLAGDKGANRCNDSFVEISWDRAVQLVAGEIGRIRETYDNSAIFGGSYGWSSSGRFHHAQGQMRRLLALAGGFTFSTETYSHAAAEVLFPHIMGLSHRAYQDQVTSLPLMTKHCQVMLAFGGIARRTAQITSAGTTTHEVGPWLDALEAAGVRVVTIAPERGDAREWLPIRPGTDVALILALIHWIVAQGREDRGFLARCTSGWDDLRAYVMGHTDGIAKTPDWASGICDIPAKTIFDLAETLSAHRSMITMAWGMQRADHGEQPLWAGLALAAVLGQIGKPGTGYAFGYGSTTPIGRAARLIPWPSLPKLPNPVTEHIPVARIADALLHPGQDYAHNGETRRYPDLRLIWWAGGNPFHHHQDLFRLEQAWTRPETVIVSEHSWTATARRADLVLPATTPLERDDFMMNRRDPTLLYMSRFRDPMGLARNDYDFSADIAEALGHRQAFTLGRSPEAWLRTLWHEAQEVGARHDIDLPDFDTFQQTGRFDIPQPDRISVAFADFVKDPDAHPLKTESGRLTLSNRRIASMGYSDCPGHPIWLPPAEGMPLAEGAFHLISGQPDTRLHAQNDLGDESLAAKIKGREVATLHPETGRHLGVRAGDILRLFNDRGACLAAVQFSNDIRADCISLPTGAWFDPQLVDGVRMDVHGNPNAVTLDKGCSSLSQGNIAHTCVVKAEKWTGPLPPLSITKPPRIDSA